MTASASHGKGRIVELLLAAGAALEHEGKFALHDALRNRGASRKKVAEVLLHAGARLDAKDRFGETAMDVAKHYGVLDELMNIAEQVRASKEGVSSRISRGCSDRPLQRLVRRHLLRASRHDTA